MKKVAVLWFAAVALILSAGTGFAAALNSGGMHGHGGVVQRQGSAHHGFERHDGFVQHRDFGRLHHFDRHSRFIIIGGPFFGAPIYYAPPLYAEQDPPVYLAPGVNYSYYCTNPSGYYPEIQYCPTGWLRVVPEISPY